MIDPNRPPFDERTFEKIKDAIYEVNQRHWPLLIEMQVPNYHPLNVPVPPQRPIHFRETIVAYALDLFEKEADFYDTFRTDSNYPPWLSRLADRVLNQVLEALDRIEQGNAKATLWYHGVVQPEIVEAVRTRLWHAANQYMQRDSSPIPVETSATEERAEKVTKSSRSNRERIDDFIGKMANAGLRVKRKDIWRVAGYGNATEFERFQRGDVRNKSAVANFQRVFNLSPEDFQKLMKRKQEPA